MPPVLLLAACTASNGFVSSVGQQVSDQCAQHAKSCCTAPGAHLLVVVPEEGHLVAEGLTVAERITGWIWLDMGAWVGCRR